MDIELLSKMIAELVPEHPEVGLPGLGTFVSEFVPASFTDRGYTITPPYKRLTFVPGSTSDNSLVALYASSNGISEDQSRAALTSFLEETKKVLLDRKTVVFPGLGRLRATRQNNIFFITDESLDIYPEGFGLDPVSLKNHEETPAEVHHVVEELAGIMVASPEEFVEPSSEAPQPAEAPEAAEAAEAVSEPEPLIPADERLEFADEPAPAEGEPRQNLAKTSDPPGKIVGGPSKSAKNDRAVRKAERIAAKTARREAIASAKAEHAAAKQAAKEAKAARRQARAETRAAAKAERVAAKAARKQARAEARAARKAARKPVPKWIWVTPLVILAVAALAAGVFFILVYAAPDFLDTLLYTPEELRIINY